MTILLIAILMQTGQPKLELPKIIVYGKRNVSLEIWKEDLIPDTVSKLELPRHITYNFETTKFSYPWRFRGRSFLMTGTAALGNDFFYGPTAFLKLFYGKTDFYTMASYCHNREMIEDGIELNARLPFVCGNFIFRKYLNDTTLVLGNGKGGRKYTRVRLESSLDKMPLFFEFKSLFGDLQGEGSELALFVTGTYLREFKNFNTTSNIHFSYDKMLLLSLTERVQKAWNNILLEPGFNIYSIDPYISPYLKLNISNYFFEYSPKAVLRTRDGCLEYNPFIKDVLKGDTSELAQHQTYITVGANFKSMNIAGGWIENYTSFDTSNTGNYYMLGVTDIVWISTSVYREGLKVRATYSHSYKLAPHIPLISVSLEYNWGNFTATPIYKCVKDYKDKTKHLLSCNLSWYSPYQFIYSISRPTFFIELGNLFTGYELWKGYHEKPKFYIGTKFKL
jgi:hypothetical protein